MSRPRGCVYPNCLKCPLPECEYDGIEIEDEAESRALDRDIFLLRLVECHNMNGTYAAYASQRKYSRSEKGKLAKKRYFASEKGKEALKRKAQKDIDTGKNAEKCRRYYARHRDEILAKKRAERMCS